MKKILKSTEIINYRDFMTGQYKIKPLKRREIRAYSFVTVSPLALFDPVVLGVAAGILSIVLLEKFCLSGSLFHLGEYLSMVINFVCPVIVFGALIYFIMTNPFIVWG